MTNTVSYSVQFQANLVGFPRGDQLKIAQFQTQFENDGLADFSKYAGKIAPSWGGLAPTDARYHFTHGHSLWHYHIGIPKYTPSVTGNYGTSDWLLHFQWPNWQQNGTHIHIVDLLQHNNGNSGLFNLPDQSALP